jgi:uncharacterized protein (TIGR02996 family)
MTNGDMILRAILTDSADDTARLAYADWLEEEGKGDAARWVRSGVAKGHEPANGGNCGEHWPLTADLRPNVTSLTGLLNASGGVASREAPRWYSRGLVWRVGLACDAFMQHAAALFAHHPITEVVLTDRRPITNAVGLWPEMNNRRRGDRAGWFAVGNLAREWVLPIPLFRRLRRTGSLKASRLCRAWRTPDEALAALSAACVAYGREMAGLPALPAPLRQVTQP